MRLSRHAKNQARRLGIVLDDAMAVIAHPQQVDVDPENRPRYVGEVRGKRIRVVVAVDDPELIVTIHERRR
jgi:hypothetical protein